jgi:hypothetical protein
VTIVFSGRLGHEPLPKGHHVASVTATDAAGNRSKPSTTTFTIVSSNFGGHRSASG